MAKKRAFISFDYDDVKYRDFLVGQARNPLSPIKIDDWSLREAFDERWKTQCRDRIKKSGIVIQLVGKNTHNAQGAVWEVKCAKEEGIPVFGVHINKKNKGKIPESLRGSQVIEWSWDGIANMVNRLAPPEPSTPRLSFLKHFPKRTTKSRNKPVHVVGYRKRNGTHVRAYRRRRPRR